MRQKIFFLSGCLLLPMQVHASSNVTIYGVVDASVTYVSDKDGGKSTELTSGILNTSRLGFRGKEDLGGGVAATFNLEAGVGVDTGSIGSSSAFWNRQSWMGLSGKSWGDVRMGFQRPSFYDIFGPMSNTPAFGSPAARIDGAGIAGSALARFNNTIGTTRYANSLKYNSPNMGGVKLHGFAALGEVVGSGSAGLTWNVGVNYKKDKLQAGLSYLKTNCKGVAGCSANQDDDQVIGVGAGYDFSSWGLNAIYTQQKHAKNVRNNNADTFSLAVSTRINAWDLAIGYQRLNDKTTLNQDVSQINFSAVYPLSKRTAVYTLLVHQRVKEDGLAGISFISSKDKQHQASVGLRHRF